LRTVGEEFQIEPGSLGDSERLCQSEALAELLVGGREDRYAIDIQSAREAIDDHGEQSVEIGLGVQVTSELDQRLTVVVTLAIENLIEPVGDVVLEWIKQQRGNDDGGDKSRRAGTREIFVEQFGGHTDRCEVDSGNRTCGERVRHAALEDQVDVHQPVAEDGVSKGQRQEYQRQYSCLHRQGWRRSPQVGNHVEEGEGHYREQRAASDPLHLLAHERSARIAIGQPENGCSGDIEGREINHLDAIQVEQHQRARGGVPKQNDVQCQEYGTRHVDKPREPRSTVKDLATLGEGHCEMQQQCRLQ